MAIKIIMVALIFVSNIHAADQIKGSRQVLAMLSSIIDNEILSRQIRTEAVKEIFQRSLTHTEKLPQVALVFDEMKWLKEGDWNVVGGMTGKWPFERARPENTLVVAVKIKPSPTGNLGRIWLAFPGNLLITEEELSSIFRGKCPERLVAATLHDVSLETD